MRSSLVSTLLVACLVGIPAVGVKASVGGAAQPEAAVDQVGAKAEQDRSARSPVDADDSDDQLELACRHLEQRMEARERVRANLDRRRVVENERMR